MTYNQHYYRTKQGLLNTVYANQKKHSISRGHSLPEYTKEEMVEWVHSQPCFDQIFKDWEISGFNRRKVPSIDRLDDSIGYSISNIQLITLGENEDKFRLQMRKGERIHKHKPPKKVARMTRDGEFVSHHISVNQAGRDTGVNNRDISSVCTGKRKTAGGFTWSFVQQGEDFLDQRVGD